MRSPVWRSGSRNCILLDRKHFNRVQEVPSKMQCMFFSVFFLGFGILLYIILPKPIIELCDLSKCPFCYGDDLCMDIKGNEISLEFNSVSKFFFNIFSVKNVYFGTYKSEHVVLKKLSYENELSKLKLTDLDCERHKVSEYLNSTENEKFKFCTDSSERLFQRVSHKNFTNICTILYVNIEPIILEMFSKNNNWPVPKLYGYCGRLVVVENAGEPLNSIENCDWYQRAYVAYQILKAARNFSEDHADFRLYLTDISPDNIVVDSNLEISFVDFGNVILKAKNRDSGFEASKHYSENYDDENFMYSEMQICENEMSDHNIFAVCKVGKSNLKIITGYKRKSCLCFIY